MKLYSVLFEELMLSPHYSFNVTKRNKDFVWVKITDTRLSIFNFKRNITIKVINNTKNKSEI